MQKKIKNGISNAGLIFVIILLIILICCVIYYLCTLVFDIDIDFIKNKTSEISGKLGSSNMQAIQDDTLKENVPEKITEKLEEEQPILEISETTKLEADAYNQKYLPYLNIDLFDIDIKIVNDMIISDGNKTKMTFNNKEFNLELLNESSIYVLDVTYDEKGYIKIINITQK